MTGAINFQPFLLAGILLNINPGNDTISSYIIRTCGFLPIGLGIKLAISPKK